MLRRILIMDKIKFVRNIVCQKRRMNIKVESERLTSITKSLMPLHAG